MIFFTEKRCDSRPDCYDRSDEFNCNRIKVDESYQKYLAPPIENKEITNILSKIIYTQDSIDLI